MGKFYYKIFFFFLFVLCLTVSTYSQDKKIDSLYNLYNNASEVEKIDLIHEIHSLTYSNEPQKALNLINEGINIAKSTKNTSKLVRLFQDKTISLLTISQYDSALIYVEEALSIAKNLNDKRGEASCISLLGTVYWYKTDFSKVISYYSKSLEMFIELGDEDRIYNSYSNLGTVYYSIGDYQKSTDYYMKAFDLIDTILYPSDAAICLNDVGLIYQECGERQKALSFFLRALELNKTANNKRSLAANLNNIGSVFLDEENYKKALNYYRQGLYVDSEIGNEFGIAFSYISLCVVYEKLDLSDSSFYYLDEAEKIFEKLENEQGLSQVFMNRGIVFSSIGNYKKSTDEYLKAIDLAEKLNDDVVLSKSFFGVGASYFELGKYEKSVEFLLKSAEIAEKQKYSLLLLDIYEYTANAYSKIKNKDEEIFYLRKYLTLRDSVFSLEKEKIASELLTKYEVEKTEASLELLKKEKIINKSKLLQQRILIILILVFLILISLVTILLYKRNIQKKRTNEILESHNLEIEEKQHEIEQQNIKLGEQAKELQELDGLKSRFFANISHEFRTPLSLIIGQVEKMLSMNNDGKTQQQLNLILRNAKKLLELINQLIDLSRIDKGAIKIKMSYGNITNEIRFITELFSSYAQEQNIELIFIAEEKEINGYFDKEKLDKIMNNLISNAIKNTEKGNINISISRVKEDEIEIKVKDTGYGIKKEDLTYIFDRFFMVENKKTMQISSGIGLAFTKEMVDLLKGKITVESKEGQGSLFCVTLPISLANYNQNEFELVENIDKKTEINYLEVLKNKDEENSKVANHKSSETILIVEDHSELREFISLNLSEKFNVIEASNGEEGVEMAIKTLPDLIVTDITMPKIDGIELTKTLKNNTDTSHIPIIILTAKVSHESKIEGLQTKADDYLSKPFNFEELFVRINNLLEIRRKLREKYMRSIEVNPSEITCNSIEEQFLEKLLKVVEENMSNTDFSVEMLCEIVGMSRSNIHKKLKSLLNQSATEFINTIRIKRAAQLLMQNAETISEIAYEVGFNSLSYFNKIFRKHFGITPTEMQNK
ncbi:MAG: tetratricopeptide repeat protein [Bacteroidales bacterium]|nr:tetratricopeptide repeat protein [Bacteroidales bacterium]